MNPELYSAINNAEEKDIELMISHICGRLKSYISNLEYLGVIMGSSEEIENMLLTMIRFFKSYTTDLISFDGSKFECIFIHGERKNVGTYESLLGNDFEIL